MTLSKGVNLSTYTLQGRRDDSLRFGNHCTTHIKPSGALNRIGHLGEEIGQILETFFVKLNILEIQSLLTLIPKIRTFIWNHAPLKELAQKLNVGQRLILLFPSTFILSTIN